ncbi:MAG: hypothetical protein KDB73_03885 [Planctomycetes bacterium]|nr:hypothetical protein [Planctomycetota bacterium]
MPGCVRSSRPAALARPAAGLLVAILAVCCAAAGAHAEDDGWWGGLDEGQNVRLDDVLASPADYSDRTLTTIVLFHARDKLYDPMRTIFNARRFANFSAWPDGAAVWDTGPYERDHPFFYVSRTHPQIGELLASRVFTRLELTLRIRARIHGRPAFEVLSWRPTGHRMGEAVVRDVMAGDNYVRSTGRSNLQLAASRYRNVLVRFPDLPPVYDMQVRRRLATVLRQLGHPREADDVEGGVPIVGGGRLPDPEQGNFPLPEPGPATPAPGTAPGIGFDDPLPAGRGAGGDAWGSPDGVGSPDGAPTASSPTSAPGMPSPAPRVVQPGAGVTGFDDPVPAAPSGFDDPLPEPSSVPDDGLGMPPVPPTRLPAPTVRGPGAMPGGAPSGTQPPVARGPAPAPAAGARRGVELPADIPPQRESRLAGVK